MKTKKYYGSITVGGETKLFASKEVFRAYRRRLAIDLRIAFTYEIFNLITFKHGN